MLNPIMAILHNTKLQRWHPILFYESPLPSGSPPVRHKSKGHHTEGFGTREEAIAHCREYSSQNNARLCIAKDLAWDGEGIPAMVVFFGEQQGQLTPMF